MCVSELGKKCEMAGDLGFAGKGLADASLGISSCLRELSGISGLIHYMLTEPHEFSDREINRITIAQARVIRFVFDNADKDVRIKDLAVSTGVTPGAVSQTVDFLVRKGLAERQTNESDHRSVFVRLTPLGRRSIEEMRHIFEDISKKLFPDITMKESEIFAKVLKTIHGRLYDLHEENFRRRISPLGVKEESVVKNDDKRAK